jgi:hypothetical protein
VTGSSARAEQHHAVDKTPTKIILANAIVIVHVLGLEGT